jgi:indole-3-glycerol phosphate synthase
VAVVTEKHFYCGEPSMLTGVAHMVNLPIIRWDFIVDAYQLMQSKLWGADAVRIIVPLLDQVELAELYKKSRELELEVIWEIHSGDDAGRIADFTESAVVYIDGDDLELDYVADILKKIPNIPPALLNGDVFAGADIQKSGFAGAIFFAPQEG